MFLLGCISNSSGIVSSAISSKLPSLAACLLDRPQGLFYCQAKGFLSGFEAWGFHLYSVLGGAYRVDFYLASAGLANLLSAHQGLLDYFDSAWFVAGYRDCSADLRSLESNLAFCDLGYRLCPF